MAGPFFILNSDTLLGTVSTDRSQYRINQEKFGYFQTKQKDVPQGYI